MVDTPGIIIVGAGVMGCSTAYWLTKAGCPVLLLEQEAMACGASGMAAAMLESVGHGARLVPDDPLGELARASLALHHELARHLPDESGVDIGYREHLGIHAAFTPEDVATFQPHALALHAQPPAVLQNRLEGLTPPQVQALIGTDTDLRALMRRMFRDGVIARLAKGVYAVKAPGAPRPSLAARVEAGELV